MRFTHISGKRKIFTRLRRSGCVSRAELARECSLTRPAVSSIVDELIADGYVREIGVGRSTGGKPPILLEFIPSARCAIGINLGGDDCIEGVLCDLSCGVLCSESVSYTNSFESIYSGLKKIIRMLEMHMQQGVLAGIGIAVSGVVDKKGQILVSPLDIGGRMLGRMLTEEFGIPVILERRPNAAALAEALFGAGSESKRLLYLTSGVGVGAGLVVGGEIFTGSHGCAGEVGSLKVSGNLALEEVARPSAMIKKYADITGKKVDFENFVELYLSEDEIAGKLVMENAELLAYAAISAANVFDPDTVILGGDVLEFGEKYFEEFKNKFLAGSVAFELGENPAVLRSTFGRRGVAVGGAQIILDALVE